MSIIKTEEARDYTTLADWEAATDLVGDDDVKINEKTKLWIIGKSEGE